MLIEMAEKKAILNLRIDPAVLAEFKLAAKLRGASMSGLLHQFIARTIREEKAEMPHEFRLHRVRKATGKLAPVVAHIEPPAAMSKKEIQAMLDEQHATKPRKRKSG